jgi:hypothetical protein
LNFLAADI